MAEQQTQEITAVDGTVIETNRLDLPAEMIAEIYRQRWLIEMFFRLFKHIPNGLLLRHRACEPEGTQGVRCFKTKAGIGAPQA
jgi:hypothetical protein